MTRFLRAAAATSLIGAAALSSGAVGSAAHAVPAASVAKVCSVKGLRFEKMDGSVTESVKVRRLRATVATCTKARRIARVVAKDSLNGKDVPETIRGFAIKQRPPCPEGCAPITRVTATKGSARVTFKVAGGE